jgi:2,3-dihydro-2,3-dihydroxybenzoate dehydrogenase
MSIQNGRSILVIGAGSKGGIAFACARALAEQGARVAIADLNASALPELARSLGGDATHSAHAMDVTDPASVEKALDEMTARHGQIDGAIIAPGVLHNQPFLDITLNAWDQTFAVNCRGVFIAGQAVARRMHKQGKGGRIVAVSSNAGCTPRLSTASYGASKAAVIQLVRCMALELAKFQITVNALCPGSTATSMMIDNQAGGDMSRLAGVIHGSVEQWRTGIPLGHLADPADQGAVAAFLMSDGARHITGQVITVDGGQTFY